MIYEMHPRQKETGRPNLLYDVIPAYKTIVKGGYILCWLF